MPVSPRQDFLTPFADESMRLLRENWSGTNGTKMLSEELFAILQQKIPNPPSGPITINLTLGTEDFAQFKNQFGDPVAAINSSGDLVKRKTATPRETPAIIWADPDPITSGTALDGTQLNAQAVDAISLYVLDGTYEYTPPSGTVLADGDNQPLQVVFTPANSVSYKRARKIVHINVGGSPTFGYLDWTPADIWADGILGASQLNATARDGNTNLPIVGTYVYTPASGSVFPAPATNEGTIHCDFTPTSPADLATYGIVSADVGIFVLGIFAVSRFAQNHATTIGDLIVVGAYVNDSASGATVAVSDTQGNSYTQADSYIESGSGGNWVSVSLWYAFAGMTGANSITITPSGTSPSLLGTKYLLYTGAVSFDGTSNAFGNGGTPSSGTTPVTGTRELIVFMATSSVDSGGSVTYAFPWDGSRDNAKDSEPQNWLADPATGTSAPFAIITGGTVTGRWAIITASFKHRTS